MDRVEMPELSQVKGVLFDKDGTLVDFEATWGPINRAIGLMAAEGDAARATRILDACGVDPATGHTRAESPLAIAGAEEIADALIAGGSTLQHAVLMQGLHRLFAEGGRKAVPLGDVAGMLLALRAMGLKTGVASSDSAEAVAASLDALGIEGLLDFHCGYDSGFGPKPQPGMVRAFCDATGLAPDAVMMVGDSTHDLAMGRAAACGLVVGVLSGTGTRDTLAPLADMLIGSVAELPPLLAR
ncbi:MAG: HAD family hydrolase [Rhizobiaceae bacterium]|nr:HAD family hydrolase [Rhizobiaceae bacterium]